MGPDLWELYEYGEADDEVAAIIRLAHFGAVPVGVRVITQFEDIITVRLHRGDIPKISGAPETAGMTSGDEYLGADLEIDAVDAEALPARSAIETDHRRPEDLAMTGRGIVIGVVDWGFDFRHPDFRRADGTTRILALWDQRGGKQADSPQPFGYGVVHTRDAINKALGEKDPYAALHYHPADADTGIGCHGTHVASIAAGTGGETRPAGMAPEADLVFVHNAPWDGLEAGKLGDSVTLLEAIDFIARTAANRPWVINLSMGRHGEQHDGTTLIEQGLDAAVRAAAGRAICLSAGNYYNKRTHASGQLRPTQSRTLAWVVNEKNPSDYNQLEVWYSWQDKFEVAVRSPDGSIVAQTRLGEKVKLLSGGKEIGNLYHRAQEPNTLDHHITIYLYKTAPAGEWTVTLTGTDVIHGNYHCWIEREVSCPKCQSHFKTEDADPTSTTGTICNGRRTIAVGAFDAHDSGHRIGAFSSVGPTRDGRLKPDLSAPGVSVLAARSAQREHWDQTPLCTRMSGTSMAAPHVTGAVALAFQAAVRRLRIEETHNLLLGSARRVSADDHDADRIGIGFLDVTAFVEAAGKVDNGQRTFVAVREKRSAPEVPPPQPVREAVEHKPAVEHVAEMHHPVRARGGLEPALEDESLRPTPGLRVDAGDSEAFDLINVDGEGGRHKRSAELVSEPTPIDAESETTEAARDNAEDPYAASFVLPEPEPVLPEPESPEPLDAREFLSRLADSASARDLFEIFAYGAERPRAAIYRDRFELVAAPRASMLGALRAGDVLVRVGDGQGYVGVIASAPLSIENAIARGFALERWKNGYFAPVLELAALPQMQSSGPARQLADAGGLLPHNQIVLRPRGVSGNAWSAEFAEDLAPVHAGGVTPPGAEARLRALLTASMVLAGNHSAPFTPGALPTLARISGPLWSYYLRFGASGALEAYDVTCRVMHTMGHTHHLMPMQVLEHVVWEDPTLQLPGGAALTLPLRPAYLLGSFQSGGGRIARSTHHLWPLESEHESGSAVVFGFDISQGGAPRPLTSLEPFEAGRAGATRASRVLVVCELVVCGARADFEPMGILEAGRIYPIAEIITDGADAEIQMAIDLRRPDASLMDHGWFSRNHLSSLFTDRNFDQGVAGELTRFYRGSSAPIPTWENLFDYFDRNPSRVAVSAVVVDPAITGTRANSTDREGWQRIPPVSRYLPSVVQKLPRQGEYDNVHIAPQMQVSLPAVPALFPGFGPVAVSMAPVCAHDCFHMHWRWGWGYRNVESLGWGPSGPNTIPGAPMVPLNQKIRIETPAFHAGLRYIAKASHQPAGQWSVIMHHGACYALHVKVDPIELLNTILGVLSPGLGLLVRAIRALVGSNSDLAWAWIYFFFQYWPTLHAPYFQENVLIHSLTALRRL